MSFTEYLTFCLVRTVYEEKPVQAYLKGHNQLVIFDNVDAGMMVERQMGATRAPIDDVVRGAIRKAFMEIHREIRAVQTGAPPRRNEAPPWFRLLQRLPGPLQAWLP